jgi:hypothetical protein
LCKEVLKELAKIHDGAANYSTTLKDSPSLVEVNDGAAGDGAEDDGKEEQLNEVVLVTTTTKHEALARIVEGQVFIIRTRKSAIRPRSFIKECMFTRQLHRRDMSSIFLSMYCAKYHDSTCSHMPAMLTLSLT